VSKLWRPTYATASHTVLACFGKILRKKTLKGMQGCPPRVLSSMHAHTSGTVTRPFTFRASPNCGFLVQASPVQASHVQASRVQASPVQASPVQASTRHVCVCVCACHTSCATATHTGLHPRVVAGGDAESRAGAERRPAAALCAAVCWAAVAPPGALGGDGQEGGARRGHDACAGRLCTCVRLSVGMRGQQLPMRCFAAA